MERTEFPNPVFIGDTLSVSTEIVDKQESELSLTEDSLVQASARNQRAKLCVNACAKAMLKLNAGHSERN